MAESDRCSQVDQVLSRFASDLPKHRRSQALTHISQGGRARARHVRHQRHQGQQHRPHGPKPSPHPADGAGQLDVRPQLSCGSLHRRRCLDCGHHLLDLVQRAGQPRRQAVRQQAEGHMACGAVVPRHPRPFWLHPSVGPKPAQPTPRRPVYRASIEPCLLPDFLPNVCLAGQRRMETELYGRPWVRTAPTVTGPPMSGVSRTGPMPVAPILSPDTPSRNKAPIHHPGLGPLLRQSTGGAFRNAITGDLRIYVKDNSGNANLYSYVRSDSVNLADPSGLTVYLCKAPAQDPTLSKLGVNHHWLKTDTKEAGIGPDGGNRILWQLVERVRESHFRLRRDRECAKVVGHDPQQERVRSGAERRREHGQCPIPGPDDDPIPAGTWGITNNCQTWAQQVLDNSRKK